MPRSTAELEILTHLGAAVTELGKMQQALVGVGEQTEKTGTRLDATKQKLEEWGPAARRTFAAVTGVVAGSTAAFASYETQLKNVQNISGQTDAAMASMTAKFMELPPTLGEADDLMRGLYQTMSSGITEPAEAFDVVVNAAKAAKGNLADMAQTVDGLTSIMNAYGIQSNESMEVLDAMTKTVDLGKLTFGELADNIGKGISISAAAGVSYQELLSTLATLTLNGLSVEEAMTSIRNILNTVLRPSKEVSDAMDQMGFDMSVSSLKAEGLGGMMGRVAEKIGDNNELTSLFFPNIRAMGGAMALASEEGGAKLAETLDDINNSTGKVEENFARQSATVKQQTEAMTAEIKKAGIAFGEMTEGPVKALIGGITDLATVFKDMSEPAKNATVQLVAIAGALSGLILIAPRIIKAYQLFAVTLRSVGTAGKAASVGMRAFTASLGPAVAIGLALNEAINLLAIHIENVADAALEASGTFEKEMGALGVAVESAGFKISELVEEFRMQSGQADATAQDLIDYIKHLDSTGKANGKWAIIVKVFNDVLNEQADAVAEVSDEVENQVDTTSDLLGSLEDLETETEKVTRLAKERKEAEEALRLKIEEQTRYNAGLTLGMEELRGEYEVINPMILEAGDQTSYLGGQMAIALDRTLALGGGFGVLGGYVYGATGEITVAEDAVEDLADTALTATTDITTAFSDMLGKGFIGELESFADLWDSLWQDLAKTMTGNLFDEIADLFKEGGDGFKGLMSLFDNSEKALGEKLGLVIGGAGMVLQSTQQQRSAMSVGQGAFGGAMAGSVFGPWGAIAGAVIGAAVAYFGGGDAPSSRGTITPWGGGVERTQGQDLGEGAWDLFTRERQEEYRAAISGMTDTLRMFGDADLFDLIGDAPTFEFAGRGSLDHFATVFREDFIPEAMRSMFETAVNRGLGDLGVTDATISRLWAELGVMTGTAVTEGLRTYIGAVVTNAELIADFDWDQILADIEMSPRDAFVDLMSGTLESVDMAMLGWDNLTLIEQAQQATEIQALMTQARQAEIQYLRQIEQISAAISSSIGSQIERLQLGGMTDFQQADYATEQLEEIFGLLMGGGLDAGTVQSLVGDAQRYIDLIAGVMGEEGLSGQLSEVLVDYFGTSAFGDLSDLMGGFDSTMTGREFLVALLEQLGTVAEGALDESRAEAEELNRAYLERLAEINERLTGFDGGLEALSGEGGTVVATVETLDELNVKSAELGDEFERVTSALNGWDPNVLDEALRNHVLIDIDPNLAPFISLIESIVAARLGQTPPPPPGGIH